MTLTRRNGSGGLGDTPGAADRRPRIMMVLDELGPGGSQRQLSILATSLHRLGYEVKVIVFRPGVFFLDALREVNVPVVFLKPRNRLHLWFLMRHEIRRGAFDVVIGFLPWANLMVELAGLPTRTFALIVSERSLDVAIGVKRRIAYHCHRLADVVVSNSYTQGEVVERILGRRNVQTKVIVNGTDIRHFRPIDSERRSVSDNIRLLVVARLSPEKNVVRFIEAVSVVCMRHPQIGLVVDWYGVTPTDGDGREAAWAAARRGKLSAYYREVVNTIARHEIQKRFRVNGPRKDVRELYQQADVVCMPSLHEGCSNVIAEAMACGKPVLASRVGDNARLVREDRNGFLFDPTSVDDMASAIVRFAETTKADRIRLGREGRKMAMEMLSVEVLTARYAKLIDEVSQRRRAE